MSARKQATASIISQYRASKQIFSAPLYASRPSAGFPAPGDDVVEKALDLNELLVRHPQATFFVRVDGDSMEGVGIFSNDILVVDRAAPVVSGAIVVAAVYGELVVKRYVQTTTGAALVSVSEHSEYKPIAVSEADDVYVWGVVVGSIRQFR